ncbi:MAG: hypothetical protein B5766_00360 [Candidatus Lumbricidophila eiseniae]|uniref:ParB/Sulfiredoxin domain-containing protein n=1 Tax=Candidatus Lumbricidiphila eiseniae TaxID=1969409 RepID=A0A2A6FV77_9MICO|nr:MAG: hypothetical protein B5766_00360 [Candidatus Lumbricidophila eiseniae]
MVYEKLPIVEVNLEELLLDLENYRIPAHPKDEAAALSYLFESEDVLGAAELIIRNGYFDNEVPIVIAASSQTGDSRYIVLEGNRRVSALKALRDPMLVPGHEKKVRGLLKRYEFEASNLPQRIRVLVTPDRAVAAPHIARLHTGLSKKRWSRDQQANFYYSLLNDSTTVDDVRAQYPSVKVVQFIKMAVMRRFLAAVPFVDVSLRQYAASDGLRMSVFEYAYLDKEIAFAIGVEFDKDGQLLPRSSTPEQIASKLSGMKLEAVEYLTNEFRENRLNTRSPEFKKKKDSSEPHTRLVNLLNGNLLISQSAVLPVRSPGPGRGVPVSGAGTGSPTPLLPSSSPGSRGPNSPNTKDTLDLSGIDYESAPVNLKFRYIELRGTNLTKLPISAAILMRSVLESTIKIHFESSSAPVTGQLASVFKQVSAYYGHNKALNSPIGTISSGDVNKQGSIAWFNMIAHSADAIVTGDDVRMAWRVVNPVLRRLLLPVESAPAGL